MSIHTLKGVLPASAHLLRFDGGARPQRGPTAGAYVLFREEEMVAEGGRFIEKGTSNIGEYTGLIAGLKKALSLGIASVMIEGDSLLVISQISGKWKVKDEKMKVLHAEAMELIGQFRNVAAAHIRRGFNAHADALSTLTLSERKDWSKLGRD